MQFVTEGLPQFPDYNDLRQCLQRVERWSQAQTNRGDLASLIYDRYLVADAMAFPAVAEFTRQFPVAPLYAYFAKMPGKFAIPAHVDMVAKTKIHYPLATANCYFAYHRSLEKEDPPCAKHYYVAEVPVLVQVDTPHAVYNDSSEEKLSLILSWDRVLFAEARDLFTRPRSAPPMPPPPS